MKNKNVVITLFLIEVVWILLYILLINNYNTFFFISIAFNLITLLTSIGLINNIEKVIDKLYPFNIREINVSLSLMLMMWINTFVFAKIFNENILSYILVSLIIYAVNFIYYIIYKSVKTNAQNIIEEQEDYVKTWKTYLLKLESIKGINDTNSYNELVDTMKYSDPINKTNKELDEEIFRLIDTLEKDKSDDVLNNLKEKITYRNKIVKTNK